MKCPKCRTNNRSNCECFKRCSKCGNISRIIKKCKKCENIDEVDPKVLGLSLNEYVKINEKDSKALAKSLFRQVDSVRNLYKISIEDIEYSEDAIQKIIDLVYKRKIYFQVFHGVEEINELKEISLYCFWLLKLQPFYWTKKGRDIEDSDFKLNVKLALGIFRSGIRFYANQNLSKGFKSNWTEQIVKDLSYSFAYRDWSKESIMDLAQSLIIETETPVKETELPAYISNP